MDQVSNGWFYFTPISSEENWCSDVNDSYQTVHEKQATGLQITDFLIVPPKAICCIITRIKKNEEHWRRKKITGSKEATPALKE